MEYKRNRKIKIKNKMAYRPYNVHIVVKKSSHIEYINM